MVYIVGGCGLGGVRGHIKAFTKLQNLLTEGWPIKCMLEDKEYSHTKFIVHTSTHTHTHTHTHAHT